MVATNTPVYIRLKIQNANDNKEIFYSNFDHQADPIEIYPGQRMIFDKVDQLLPTMKVGDKKTLTLSHNDAFGEYSEQAVKKIPAEELTPDLRMLGTQVTTEIDSGQTIYYDRFQSYTRRKNDHRRI
jgi:FKBP-type peptidyl-prolyl cis-trans isomerase 2